MFFFVMHLWRIIDNFLIFASLGAFGIIETNLSLHGSHVKTGEQTGDVVAQHVEQTGSDVDSPHTWLYLKEMFEATGHRE